MQRVYTGENVFDAQLVCDRLNEHGVAATVHGIMLVGGIGELPADTRPSVWITDGGDYDAARHLIAAFEAETVTAPDWACGHCGEANGATFEVCWYCGGEGRLSWQR